VVINHYSQPESKKQFQNELIFISNSVRQFHPEVNVITAGDFNDEQATLLYIANKTGLVLAQHKDENWHTRKQMYRRKAVESTIDHFLTDHPVNSLFKVEVAKESDHCCIAIEYTITTAPNVKSNMVVQDRIRFGTNAAQISKIIMDDKWPNHPFIEVAKQKQRTQQCKFKKADAHYLT